VGLWSPGHGARTACTCIEWMLVSTLNKQSQTADRG